MAICTGLFVFFNTATAIQSLAPEWMHTRPESGSGLIGKTLSKKVARKCEG